MSTRYSEVRKLIIEYLIKHPEGSFQPMIDDPTKEWFGDDVTRELMQQVCHDLYLDRIVMLGRVNSGQAQFGLGWPYYILTKHGRNIVEQITEYEYDPYDPEEYIEKLKNKIPSIDNTIMVYITEAQYTLQSGFILSSAVMLGGAAEKAMLLLIESYGEAISDIKKQEEFERKTGKRLIGKKYEEFMKIFKPQICKLPVELQDEIDTKLDRIFDMIRRIRNDAGHPVGKRIDRESIVANLILFPIYCKHLYSLIDYLKTHSV
jgi:hypothetical protein